MKKICSLTKVFIKEFYQNLPIFDREKNKFNKKSVFFWLISILFIGITYVSHGIISFLVDAGQSELFLNLYFIILALFLIFQIILICSNIFFFSKDIKDVLHMPIKSEELLIAKLSTLVFMLYISELIFGLVPLTLYGLMTNVHFVFYFWEMLILAIFPILLAVVIAILTLFIMRFFKFIKNKDIFQLFITVILLVFIFILEFYVLQSFLGIKNDEQGLQQIASISERANRANKYFLIINPSRDILLNPASINSIVSFGKLLLYNIIAIFTFILIGKKTYIKDILKSMSISSKKNKKEVNVKKFLRTYSKSNTYIIKEIKSLWREPVFFIHCVLPIIAILVTFIVFGIAGESLIKYIMADDTVRNLINNLEINAEIICYILIILQFLFSIPTISLTAISREGKNAIFIKYIPIQLYNQFIYKNIPQVVLNFIVTVIVLSVIWYIIPSMNGIYILELLIIATLINIINSYLMVIVDLRRPNLNWNTAYSVVKKSDNKFFQYVLMIVNILFLMYIARIFENINIFMVLSIEIIIFLTIFIIIDRCVKKWQNKLFNKII